MSKTTPIEALTTYAKQADPDGILVTVSREAIDWAVSHIKELEADNTRLREALRTIALRAIRYVGPKCSTPASIALEDK